MLVRILNSKLDEKEVHNVQISLIFKNRIFKIDKQALVNIRFKVLEFIFMIQKFLLV